MHYVIERATVPGKQLTPAQRRSSLYAEEPVVMGKILRRGLPPMKITKEQFEINKTHLTRLEQAGAIKITQVIRLTEKETEKLEQILERKEETPPKLIVSELDLPADFSAEPVQVEIEAAIVEEVPSIEAQAEEEPQLTTEQPEKRKKGKRKE